MAPVRVEELVLLDDYQEGTRRTSMAAPGAPVQTHQLAVWGLGIAGEAGEVADLIKKVIGHGHPMDKEKLTKELGDVLWYVAALADLHGIPLHVVAKANLEKLAKRYPNGFSQEASRNRTE
jgi:NTP pyrophosphatase (non-canonical NTP hydrolase)